MKIRELTEAISLTKYTATARSIIRRTIRDVMKSSINYVQTMDDSNEKIVERVKRYMLSKLAGRIADALAVEFHIEGVETVYFTELDKNVGGRARNLEIDINLQYCRNINNEIFNAMEHEVSVASDSFKEQYAEFMTYGEIDWFIDDTIDDIASIFIHELVHVRQHAKQQHRLKQGKDLEYRSLLTRNKQTFYSSVRNLISDYDKKLYLSSPQEIPAHAHNLAIKLIDIATMGYNINTLDDKFLLYSIIENLKDIIQDNRNWKHDAYYNQYKQFNDPNDYKKYQVYKRFLTAVYKEIMSVIEHIQDRIQYLEQNRDNYED